MGMDIPPVRQHRPAAVRYGIARARSARKDAQPDWSFRTLQHLSDNVFVVGRNGHIVLANLALVETLGLSGTGDCIGRTEFDLFPPETASIMRDLDAGILMTGQPVIDQELDIVHADGRRRWIRASRNPIYDEGREIVGVACSFRDITEAKESERLVLAQANLLDMLAQSASLAEICERVVALVEDHLPGTTASIHLLGPDTPRLPAPADVSAEPADGVAACLQLVALRAIESGEPVVVPDSDGEASFSKAWPRLRERNVRAVWSFPIFSLEGKALGTLGLLSSLASTPTIAQGDLITMASHMVIAAQERQESAERIQFLARHDALTSLPNRTTFEERLAQALDRCGQGEGCVGLAFFDLDNFKRINDSLGHGCGDALLKAVAERTSGGLRVDDVAARLGGDEFVVFFHHPTGRSDLLEQRFETIRQAISTPVDFEGRTVDITCSMGVAYFPDHAGDSTSLIAAADLAMYRAKESGRNNLQVFAPDMRDSANERSSRIAELRRAVEEHQFVLHYQPQVDLDTGRIFGVEALVRWQHPDRGLVYPDAFISLSEETGLIVPLGNWILNAACRQNRLWQDEGFEPIVVSVNVSARQFRDLDFLDRVSTALTESGLDPSWLELELTESLILHEGAHATMDALRQLGVNISIDDFGTGYSNLSALKAFPLTRLKIDRSLIRDISMDEKDQAITSAIVLMAKKLNLQVVAEGVETLDQVRLVHQTGCREVQGYYFSKPVAADRIRHLFGPVGELPWNRSSWTSVRDDGPGATVS